MQPTGVLRDGAVRVGGDARQRFYDSRGYGRPLSGNEIALTRVEAAHLLFRGDLSGIDLGDDEGASGIGETVGFERFFVASAAAESRFAVRYLVYADLRDRGFYLSPVREGWDGGRDGADFGDDVDLIAYERGSTPDTGDVLHPVRVVGERESLPAAGLAGRTLAVVDEESDLTYFAATEPEMGGATDYEPPATLSGVLLSDRVVVWDAPERLYERGFYGQPLTGRAAEIEGAVQLSLLEAASLASDGVLTLDEAIGGAGKTGRTDDPAAATAAILDRGRAVEGERFDRRLAVYRELRRGKAVPKTGFKFGADFRTYLDVETIEDLPHSTHLVRVVEPDHVFSPRELSLDVRLAGGVRKEMTFALTDGSPVRGDAGDGADRADGDDATGTDADIEWLAVTRLTP
ncbi:tRNA-intron lyase [Halorubrum gandharaense]